MGDTLAQWETWHKLAVRETFCFSFRHFNSEKEKHFPNTGTCSDRTRGDGCNLKESKLRLDMKKIFYCEGHEAMEQDAQRSCGSTIL